MKKDLFKLCFFVVLLVATLIGCESENVTEHKIVYARYTSIVEGVFDKELEETLEITYINKNGEYETDSIDPQYRLSFGEENKVTITDEGNFLEMTEYMLTKEAYNKIVSSSPMVVDLESEVQGG